ncbi:hypothetical protein Q5752_005608 [Cryptotrichosporon argae]
MAANQAYSAILNDLNRDVAREQPSDVVQFCADWFQDRLRNDRASTKSAVSPSRRGPPGTLPAFNKAAVTDAGPMLSPYSEHGPSDNPFGGPRRATIASGFPGAPLFTQPFGQAPTSLGAPAGAAKEPSPFSEDAPPFGASPFGQSGSSSQSEYQDEAPDDPAHDDPPIPTYALGRRTSVSAESLVPAHHRPFDPSQETLTEEDETTPNLNAGATPSFPKTDEQLARIRAAIKPNFLFRNLDDEQEADILAAMKEITLQPGETIIEQGAAGDYFYVVEGGELDVFVKRDGQVLEPEKGDKPGLGKKVATCRTGSSFGELALMHNAPRAASIISLTPCTLWALDRVSFRTILLDHTSRKRRLYESFLSSVSILGSLEPQERAKIADVLESRTYQAGEEIVVEGDPGDEFFLIESGTATAFKRDQDGTEHAVKQLGRGEYFGELALLNRQRRAATVRASDRLRVAVIGEEAFTRLLGPVKDIMARSANDRYGYAVGR